jgi:hypothetical protein
MLITLRVFQSEMLSAIKMRVCMHVPRGRNAAALSFPPPFFHPAPVWATFTHQGVVTPPLLEAKRNGLWIGGVCGHEGVATLFAHIIHHPSERYVSC